MSCAVGFRVRTARATAVVVALGRGTPEVRLRRELELRDPAVPESAHPYHAGLEGEGPEFEGDVDRGCEAARRVTLEAVRELVEEVRAGGAKLVAAGLVVGSDGDPAKLGNPHVRAHAEEGRLFKQAVEEAVKRCGLSSRVHVERELWLEAEMELGGAADALKATVTEMGRAVGRPWRAQEKAAAVAAWMALRTRR